MSNIIRRIDNRSARGIFLAIRGLGLTSVILCLHCAATAWGADPNVADAAQSSAAVAAPLPWYQQPTPIGIAVWRIIAFVVALAVAYIAGRIVRVMLVALAARFDARQRTFMAIVLRVLARSAVLGLLVVALRIGLDLLSLPASLAGLVATVNGVLLTVVFAYALYCLVDLVDVWLMQLATRTESKLDDMIVPMVRTTLRVTIVVLALVQITTLLSDKPMTSVIAGLGVGGLAIGLAGQETVKNFFGSLTIFADRPFEIGSMVEACGETGTIEVVGFRSTRLRTLDGHLVTIPNGVLAADKIKNVAARPYIRRTMTLGLTYDTTPDKMREALGILRELLGDHEGQLPEWPARIFFSDFQDSALAITVIYWYSPADNWQFQAFNERLNLEILTRFSAAGLSFAFPSRTIYMAPAEEGTDPVPQNVA